MLPIKARFIHNEDRLRGLISVLWSPWRAGESKCSLLVNTGSLLKHFALVGSTVFESVPSSRSASRYFCSWLFALRFRSDWRGSLISLGWTAASRILYFRAVLVVNFARSREQPCLSFKIQLDPLPVPLYRLRPLIYTFPWSVTID